MIDKRPNDSDLPEKLTPSQSLETSDNSAQTSTETASTVLALQDEVIRLREEGRPDVKKFPKKGDVLPPYSSDSLTAVQDYSPLLAILDPQSTLAKPQAPQSADDQLLGLLDTPKRSIAIAQQENLIDTCKPEKIAVNPNEQFLGILDTPKNTVALAPPQDNLPATSHPENVLANSNLSKPFIQPTESLKTDNTIAFLGESTVESSRSRSLENTLAFAPKQQSQELSGDNQNTTHVAQNSTKSFDKITEPTPYKAPSVEIASASPPNPPSFMGNSITETKVTRTIASNLGITDSNFSQKPSSEQQTFIAQNSNNQPAQQTLHSTDVPARSTPATPTNPSVAFTYPGQPPSEQQPKEVASSPLPTATTSKEQIAFNPNSSPAAQNASLNLEASAKQQDLSKSTLVHEAGSPSIRQPMQVQSTSDRPTIASAAAADFAPSIPQSARELAKESKDKDLQRDLQIANALNYPKYGGAAPVEESSKPVVQQQAPQNFKSSLARDSAPGKAHPLSESFVSGKILSQPNKETAESKASDGKNTSGIDSKAVSAKSTDAKSVDSKSADTKSPDTKFVEAKADSKLSSIDTKFPEGRTSDGRLADQRSLDSSYALSPGVKFGTDAQLNPLGQPLMGERIVPGSISPGQAGKPVEGQPTGKAESGQKADTTSADGSATDKTGKKHDGADDKKEGPITGKAPGTPADTSKIPGSKAFNDLLDFIDKADQTDIKGGGKATPLTGSNILFPDDVLVTGTGAIGQAGIAGVMGDGKDEISDEDKLSQRRKKYIVQPGDTIDSIAESELGDARYANLILTINQANIATKIEGGKKIAINLQPGQIIWLPSDHELQVHAEIYLLD